MKSNGEGVSPSSFDASITCSGLTFWSTAWNTKVRAERWRKVLAHRNTACPPRGPGNTPPTKRIDDLTISTFAGNNGHPDEAASVDDRIMSTLFSSNGSWDYLTSRLLNRQQLTGRPGL
jgi:hypothetical protein